MNLRMIATLEIELDVECDIVPGLRRPEAELCSVEMHNQDILWLLGRRERKQIEEQALEEYERIEAEKKDKIEHATDRVMDERKLEPTTEVRG